MFTYLLAHRRTAASAVVRTHAAPRARTYDSVACTMAPTHTRGAEILNLQGPALAHHGPQGGRDTQVAYGQLPCSIRHVCAHRRLRSSDRRKVSNIFGTFQDRAFYAARPREGLDRARPCISARGGRCAHRRRRWAGSGCWRRDIDSPRGSWCWCVCFSAEESLTYGAPARLPSELSHDVTAHLGMAAISEG